MKTSLEKILRSIPIKEEGRSGLELAKLCGVHPMTILRIERSALKKLFFALLPVYKELFHRNPQPPNLQTNR